MATYNKFNQFAEDVIEAKHNFASHVFKVMLTNTAPLATNSVKTDLTEVSAGNGYTAGGNVSTVTTSISGGTAKATTADVLFTASGGPVGPFRYAVLYNSTQTSPSQPLVSWWDYGSSITLADTETLSVAFDAVNGIFQIT